MVAKKAIRIDGVVSGKRRFGLNLCSTDDKPGLIRYH